MRTSYRQIKSWFANFVLLGVSLTAQGQCKLYFVHNDHLGTPQVITDENQQIVWQADYTPFGQTTITTNTLDNPLRFPGPVL